MSDYKLFRKDKKSFVKTVLAGVRLPLDEPFSFAKKDEGWFLVKERFFLLLLMFL